MTDLEVLWCLDFHPELPCEHSEHERTHKPGDPARYLVHLNACPRKECRRPPKEYLICESGWDLMMRQHMLACQKCFHLVSRPGDGHVTIIKDLKNI